MRCTPLDRIARGRFLNKVIIAYRPKTSEDMQMVWEKTRCSLAGTRVCKGPAVSTNLETNGLKRNEGRQDSRSSGQRERRGRILQGLLGEAFYSE